jgi:hypothetical protein
VSLATGFSGAECTGCFWEVYAKLDVPNELMSLFAPDAILEISSRGPLPHSSPVYSLQLLERLKNEVLSCRLGENSEISGSPLLPSTFRFTFTYHSRLQWNKSQRTNLSEELSANTRSLHHRVWED